MPTRSSSSASSHHDQGKLDLPLQRGPILRHSTSAHSHNSQYRNSYHRPSCQQEECEHGLLSPHASPPSRSSSVRHSNAGDSCDYTATHLDYASQPSEGIEHTESGNGGAFGGRKAGETDISRGLLGDAVADGLLGVGSGGDEDGGGDGDKRARAKWKGAVQGMSTTQWLAKKHGIKGSRTMYVAITLFPSELIEVGIRGIMLQKHH